MLRRAVMMIGLASVLASARSAQDAPVVRREVFAEHASIRVVEAIARTTRQGKQGVLIVGRGYNVSTACFVEDTGATSCVLLPIDVDRARLLPPPGTGDAELLVHAGSGRPAVARIDQANQVAWRLDAKYTATGDFAIQSYNGRTEAAIIDDHKRLLLVDAATGVLRRSVALPIPLDPDIVRIPGSDGRGYLMGADRAGQVAVFTSAGEPLGRWPKKTAYRFVASGGALPVAFTTIGETIYSVDERMHKAGGWQAPRSSDLYLAAIDQAASDPGVVLALFNTAGLGRLTTGLYVFGPERQLLHVERGLYPNQGLLLLSNGPRSVSFLVGDNGRTWRYSVAW